MNTSADAPYLDCVYKLVEYAGVPRRKRSEGKATWPGCKQVFRRLGADGRIDADCIALDGEYQDGIALLAPVMLDGARLALPTLDASRDYAARQLTTLPTRTRALTAAAPVAVGISPALAALVREMDGQA